MERTARTTSRWTGAGILALGALLLPGCVLDDCGEDDWGGGRETCTADAIAVPLFFGALLGELLDGDDGCGRDRGPRIHQSARRSRGRGCR